MSAKPTPGADRIKECNVGYRVCVGERTVAIFARDGFVKDEQAHANARAWVDGIAALEALSKIRAVEREWSESRANAGPCMAAIAKILDEAKP